jgi:hypothetical protein
MPVAIERGAPDSTPGRQVVFFTCRCVSRTPEVFVASAEDIEEVGYVRDFSTRRANGDYRFAGRLGPCVVPEDERLSRYSWSTWHRSV